MIPDVGLVYTISQVGEFLGYILHHTRGKAVKVDHVIKLVLWQVVLLPLSKTFPLVSFLAAFAVVYGLYGLFAPLARLTYCCYLLHQEILAMFTLSTLSFFPSDVSHEMISYS